jgi:ankyrin repeat protein
MSKTTFYKALKERDLDTINLLLMTYDIEIFDNEKNAIVWHIKYNDFNDEDFKVLEILIKNGANINGKNKHGQTLLHYAVEYNHSKMMENLLELGIEIDELDDAQQSALHYAVYNCNLYNTIVLLNYNANTDIQDNNGWTPLMYLAIPLFHQHVNTENMLPIEDYLIKFTNVRLRNNDGQTVKDIAKIFDNKRIYKKIS